MVRPERKPRHAIESTALSQVPQEHRRQAPHSVVCAVVTVSDTRTLETDEGGRVLAETLRSAGHGAVHHQIVRDDPTQIRDAVSALTAREEIDAILITGGTGLGSRDQTIEAIQPLLSREMPGFGELFRMLSFQEVGAAAMLSRAMGGLAGRTVVFALPGSPAGVRLAVEKLILPELGHLVREARR